MKKWKSVSKNIFPSSLKENDLNDRKGISYNKSVSEKVKICYFSYMKYETNITIFHKMVNAEFENRVTMKITLIPFKFMWYVNFKKCLFMYTLVSIIHLYALGLVSEQNIKF